MREGAGAFHRLQAQTPRNGEYRKLFDAAAMKEGAKR
jgi:hypothetical protein